MTVEHVSSLPPQVLSLVEMRPAEDLLLDLVTPLLPGVNVGSLIADDQTFPFVLIRNVGAWGEWDGDPRFLDSAQVNVHVFCDGINADEDAALLSEAVRVVFNDIKNIVVPGKGHVVRVEMMERPRRVADWATATGPVQYADLPSGTVRYETIYHFIIRKPATKPFA